MAKRTPPCEVYPKWSTARYWGFIRGALRSAFRKYPPKYECLAAASKPYKGGDKRRKKEWQCAICNEWFKSTDIQVDHIHACGSLKSYSDLAGFVKRMFCSIDGLRCLCKECHKVVTAADRCRTSEERDNDSS